MPRLRAQRPFFAVVGRDLWLTYYRRVAWRRDDPRWNLVDPSDPRDVSRAVRHPILTAVVCGFFPAGLFWAGAVWTFIPGVLAIWVASSGLVGWRAIVLRRAVHSLDGTAEVWTKDEPPSNVKRVE
jgi:protein-S-isoprenylcysteine O-methyltransferase Ste14